MSEFPLCFRRAYGDPAASGVIRTCADDFCVDEVLGIRLSGAGEHVYLQIEKRDTNTEWLAKQLARFCGIRSRDISYSGKKDRHAVTNQWFSCWLPGKRDPDWSALQLDGVRVLQAVRHQQKLRRGAHAANQFDITIRQLTQDPDLQYRLEQITQHGFPNYFGEQRFGINGGNLVGADEMFRSDRQAAGKSRDPGREQRGMFLSAARGYLFNRALSAQIEAGAWATLGSEDFAWLPGSSRTDPNPCASQPGMISDWFEGLSSRGVKAMRRLLRVVPQQFCWEVLEDALRVSFTLPAGAYATSLLRELVDYRNASDPSGLTMVARGG